MMMVMTEKELQASVISVAKQLGFLVYHTMVSFGSDRGFPDLIVAGHGVCFAFEFKGPRGRVSDAQNEWIETLNTTGVQARFVYPADYDDVLAWLQDAYQEAS